VLLNDFVPVRALRYCDTPTLAVERFKLNIVGFAQQDLGNGRSLPYSVRTGAVAWSDATPGTVSTALRCCHLATRIGGSHLINLPLRGLLLRERWPTCGDSLHGSVHAILRDLLCLMCKLRVLCKITVEKSALV